jgi:hypothetical protein
MSLAAVSPSLQRRTACWKGLGRADRLGETFRRSLVLGARGCLGGSEKRESIACEAALLEAGVVRRIRSGWAALDPCAAKSRSSSLRCGCAAGWLGVLDMLRWAVHDGDIRRIWQSGVRVSGDGRSRSSPSDRELMVVYLQGWRAFMDADRSCNGNWSEVQRRHSYMLRVPKICLPGTEHLVVIAQDIRSRTSATLRHATAVHCNPRLGTFALQL